jgi:hypothetical protein
MSATETTRATGDLRPGGGAVPKPNGKTKKDKTFQTQLGTELNTGKEGCISGRVKNISVKSTGERFCEYHFELIGKKAGCRRYALDTSDVRRLSMFGGLVSVAHSTNAKINVMSASGSDGLDYVTELEFVAKR